MWCSFWGVFGHKKLKNKEIAKKYDVVNSNVTYYCQKVNFFIKKNKKILRIFSELYDLMKESLNEKDREDDMYNRIERHQDKNLNIFEE